MKRFKDYFRGIKKHISQYYWSIRELFLYEIPARFTKVYPESVNFPITSRCNCRCIMCNVWKSKDKDITPQEIGTIFRDPLFKKISNIGLSGGEPTLRKDLLTCVEEIINSVKTLKSLSVITNGVQSSVVVSQMCNIYEACKKNNIRFNISVSLDGIGKVHNQSRGRDVFDAVDETISRLQDEKCFDYISIACTITNVNYNRLEEVYAYCRKKNLNVFFQIADEIYRLNNSNLRKNFELNDEQKNEICIFLSKIMDDYDRWSMSRFKLKNIIHMLGEGSKRNIGCVMHCKGVGLHSTGALSYCHVRSNLLGNALLESAEKIYFNKENLDHRRDILRNQCVTCIHNYSGRIKLSDLLSETWKSIFAICYDNLARSTLLFSCFLRKTLFKFRKEKQKTADKVFITGHYGSETIGDKAILHGILQLYDEKYQPQKYLLGVFS